METNYKRDDKDMFSYIVRSADDVKSIEDFIKEVPAKIIVSSDDIEHAHIFIRPYTTGSQLRVLAQPFNCKIDRIEFGEGVDVRRDETTRLLGLSDLVF